MSGSSNSVAARLEELERDIAFLQRDLVREQRENAELQMEVSTLKRKVSQMEGEMEEVSTLKRKVSQMEEEMKRPEDRLSAQACAPPLTPSTPTPSTPTPSTSTPSTQTPSTPTPSTPPAPPAKNKGAKNLTPEQWKRKTERARSFFDVEMTRRRTIQVTRQRVEGYDRVTRQSDCFDTKTGVYTTFVFGIYAFGVARWISRKDGEGDGDVKYYLCGGDGRRKEVFVSRESDVVYQWSYVDWDCPEGFEVWVEVEAGRGGDGLTYRIEFNGG